MPKNEVDLRRKTSFLYFFLKNVASILDMSLFLFFLQDIFILNELIRNTQDTLDRKYLITISFWYLRLIYDPNL